MNVKELIDILNVYDGAMDVIIECGPDEEEHLDVQDAINWNGLLLLRRKE